MKHLKDIKDWKECINEVVCGDCLEGMKLIPDGAIDLILSDPPYGINYDAQQTGRPNIKGFDLIQNDNIEMDFSFLFNRPEIKIMFGAENYYKQLPHSGRWICWDKRCTERADKLLGSAFELAWISKDSGYYRIYRVQHGGVINANAIKGANRKRVHPTEKPIRLMEKILEDFTKEGDLVCDPFMGSWTTARACKNLGRNFIGFEIDEDYSTIGEKRLEQMNLF